MTAEKGVDDVRRIAESLPDEAARQTRIVFLGGSVTGMSRIGKVEVFHAGFVTDIYDAMAGLDLLWHPARDEGLGTALIDALALGVPPIAFAVGGVPEIVRNGIEGILVSPGALEEFVHAHVSMLNAEKRGKLASSGPARAALFNVDRMTKNTERVYESVLTI
jgi:glycosyltransferase involved in cell wall biosynthesis